MKRDSLTPPRKGLLNQSSVEDDDVRGGNCEQFEFDFQVFPSKQSTPDIRLEFWDIAPKVLMQQQ